MDKKLSKSTKIIATLIAQYVFIISIHSSLVHSREVAHDHLPPSPSPMNGEEIAKGTVLEKAKKGSFPARCHSKCNQCHPCMPVEVSIRSMELKEKEFYYPQVWKCVCGDDIFSP